MTNRWAIVSVSEHIHLSIVGHCLNQMFLRLIRITSVLQFMKILCEQSSCGLNVREKTNKQDFV